MVQRVEANGWRFRGGFSNMQKSPLHLVVFFFFQVGISSSEGHKDRMNRTRFSCKVFLETFCEISDSWMVLRFLICQTLRWPTAS